jgi:dipeptidyl aminopeptidase/acylaminoacyl peptidase
VGHLCQLSRLSFMAKPKRGSEKLQLTYAPVNISMPRWSPDGRQIAYSCVLPGKSPKVCIISADGGASQEVPMDENHWRVECKSQRFAIGRPPVTVCCPRTR